MRLACENDRDLPVRVAGKHSRQAIWVLEEEICSLVRGKPTSKTEDQGARGIDLDACPQEQLCALSSSCLPQ